MAGCCVVITSSPTAHWWSPTLAKQCWGFMVGSAFFALGSTPGLNVLMGVHVANILFFVGAWFFTAAGLVQLALSGSPRVVMTRAGATRMSPGWLAAAVQSAGTVLFNLSTTGALFAVTAQAERRYVWSPDAGGSTAFLVSAVFAVVAYRYSTEPPTSLWNPRDSAWWAEVINFAGCVAFGISAIGAFVLVDGATLSVSVATVGTFIGAVCFFVASLIALPRRRCA